MAWTAPRTWVVGELVTAAIMNTHIRDNFSYLKDLGTYSIFYPALMFYDSSVPAFHTIEDVGATCNDTNDFTTVLFKVPGNFISVTSALIWSRATDTNATTSIKISAWYAQSGQAYATHTETDTRNYNLTNTIVFSMDATVSLTALAVGDMGGISVYNMEGVTGQFIVYGMELDYIGTA